ncbi:hypothetical protein BJ138DRAFT_147906 [Hygrophoropsis aurantiaca]|uniref:Uncharacterized protein n=1 Tax=Hygrophoropsis aurantiaca TaxID=72124 RepID=A0ACB8AP05_9AGAM|nr:hypothetical protein BJ138DRAFT_147906 [Hygrophoropsis aurantiaca]
MSDSFSPARQKTVKVQYTGRAKRRRGAINDVENPSEEESETSQAEMSGEKSDTHSPKTVAKNSGPKKVDVHLPGPSPKRVRRDSEESQVLSAKPVSKTSKAPHSRRSSVSSLQRPQRHESPSLRSSQSKPLSEMGSLAISSSKQADAPDEDEDDDTSSIAESSNGGTTRIRRTEAERIQYFKDQTDCSEMEPHRVYCTRCNKWVNLGRRTTYAVRSWEVHRSKCDKKPPTTKEPSQKADELNNVITVKSEPGTSAKPVSIKSEDDEAARLARLKADPRAQEIKPHEVLCRSCHKWIQLSSSQAYALDNWEIHPQQCSRPAPNSRVATAERKLTLLGDPQAKLPTPQSVECAFCKSTIALDGATEYDLTRWNDHKAQCTSKPPVAQATPAAKASLSRRSRIFEQSSQGVLDSPITPANYSTRPPLSSGSASTDATAIASDSSPSARTGVKRKREEENLQEEGHISNRPRTETYEPPHKEAPGPLGWFLQPFKAFVRGFREGLGSSTST